MNIATVIDNLKTYLEGLSWASDDGKGTTSFNAVFTYPNYSHDEGYPFAIIKDSGESTDSLDNRTLQGDITIDVEVCVNWAGIDAQDDALKREEAALRIREATDALKSELMKIATQSTLGVDWSMEWAYGDIELVEQENLLRRVFTLIVKETIDR